MLDNLDDQETTPLFQEGGKEDHFAEATKPSLARLFSRKVLGLDPSQLFILLLMLLVVVFLLGSVILLLSGRIMLPIK